MINIQKELFERGIDAVINKYNLLYKDYGNKFLLKYSQINSIEFKAVQSVRECRGIILDKQFNVLALPFVRFFNYGEIEADELDHDNLHVYKKEDGSLINVYFDPYLNKFCIQTSGTAEAESQVGILNLSFKELFLRTVDLDFSNLNPNYNYVFELCCLENKVVEHHQQNYASLLTIRDITKLNDGKYGELKRCQIEEIADELSLNIVPQYDFNSFDDIIEKTKQLPETREGYVIVDDNFKRIKVKNPRYVLLHQLKSSLSLDNLLKVILNQEQDEFISYFPEYEGIINQYTDVFENLIAKIENLIEEVDEKFSFNDRKEVAIFLNSEKKELSLFHDIVYRCFDGQVNVSNELRTEKKYNSLKKYIKNETQS